MASIIKFLFSLVSVVCGIAVGVALWKVEKIPTPHDLPRVQVAIVGGSVSFLVALGVQFLLLACAQSGQNKKKVASAKKNGKAKQKTVTPKKETSTPKKTPQKKHKAKPKAEVCLTVLQFCLFLILICHTFFSSRFFLALSVCVFVVVACSLSVYC